eukprot:c20130_g1_i2.p1 GENE.c20130_g1_i2~~c20130_g1_i2.p1  ORF type:complete len:384 (+),score=163.59 c20130_g1_i2:38-1189(+)
MPAVSSTRHNLVGAAIMIMDIGFVITLLLFNQFDHTASPPSGKIDTGATIGWLGCIGAILAFGCYGVLIKTPAIEDAKVDTMVFQCYYSAGVAIFSLLIWIASDVQNFTFSYWGFVFAFLWVICSLTAYNAIRALGYAVGPSIWAGFTIVVSFVWGTVAFSDPVNNVPGAVCGLIVLISGICLAAASQSSLPTKLKARFGSELNEEFIHKKSEANEANADQQVGVGRFLFGTCMALLTGLANGSLMVPLRCFEHGCFGSEPFKGSEIASLAFLPSLSIGVAAVTPVIFLFYFRFTIPEMHLKVVLLPGLISGCYWATGNFCSMWATQFLGQTIGFPLTQTCIVINGFWGILYFKEITGTYPIGIFVAAVVVIISGAIMIGNFA